MQSDFLVVGAGAIGLSTALELAGRGASVCVLDQGMAGQESTWAGGGILSPLLPWNYGEAVNALSEYSRAMFPGWCAGLQGLSGHDPELRQTGMLVLPPFDASAAMVWCDRHGWELGLREPRDFLPEAGAATGLWLPGVFQARNPRLAWALRGAAEARGVKILERTRVERLAVSGSRVIGVHANCGLLGAGATVLAAGAWSGGVPGLEPLARRVFPVRGQMLLFQAHAGVLPTIVLQGGRYLIPRTDGHVLAGSTLEVVGFDKSTTEQARVELLAFASGLVPTLNEKLLVRHWSGLRPGSPDNVPLVGPHPDLRGLYLNTGHFRYGVTMAPGSARLLADLIEGVVPEIDPAPYQLASHLGHGLAFQGGNVAR